MKRRAYREAHDTRAERKMHIIGFLIFGLIIGLLARAIFPGRQQMGWLATAILGMVGSLVGGLIGHAIWGGNSQANGSWGFTPGGWISSIIGAIIVLWIYLAIAGRRTRPV
jgi:uncharacterized membrane protein YeaQ/YmgE (transglycosylase-associated protein family)